MFYNNCRIIVIPINFADYSSCWVVWLWSMFNISVCQPSSSHLIQLTCSYFHTGSGKPWVVLKTMWAFHCLQIVINGILITTVMKAPTARFQIRQKFGIIFWLLLQNGLTWFFYDVSLKKFSCIVVWTNLTFRSDIWMMLIWYMDDVWQWEHS